MGKKRLLICCFNNFLPLAAKRKKKKLIENKNHIKASINCGELYTNRHFNVKPVLAVWYYWLAV
jgi:hypothetical protein